MNLTDSSPIKFKMTAENATATLSTQLRELEDVREFKKSICYKALEQAVLMGEDLQEREEEMEGACFKKLELESDQGSSICRTYL